MGAKKATLDTLLAKFPPGTSASIILQTMGKPDAVVTRLPGVHADATGQSAQTESDAQGGGEGLPTMPGPVVASGAGATAAQGAQNAYMIYQWRGWHDYIWFKYDTASEKVLESEWYFAYE